MTSTIDTHDELTPPLKDRWSPRVFDDRHELTDAELAVLLEAARWAPSCGNSQPWAFLLARRGDETHARLVAHLSRGNSGWVPRASAVLVAVHQVAVEPGAEGWDDFGWAAYDLGQAAAHLTVQAASMGLVVHQFAGFDQDGVAQAFGVPPTWQVKTGVAVGRLGDPATTEVPERNRAERTRKPLEEFVFAGAWGRPAAVVR